MIDDLTGWAAAALTLLTFSVRSMAALRTAAIAANICFILYGTVNGLYPVAVQHVVLLPCNILRLRELRREHRLSRRLETADERR